VPGGQQFLFDLKGLLGQIQQGGGTTPVTPNPTPSPVPTPTPTPSQ
jgi:hypothetical protein